MNREDSAQGAPLATSRGDLERALGLKEAVALNMIEMVGIGPFVVIPLVIKAMGGPQCLLAWAAGAVLALLDGFVWSELGAAMPLAGGSYVFLREAYGPRSAWLPEQSASLSMLPIFIRSEHTDKRQSPAHS